MLFDRGVLDERCPRWSLEKGREVKLKFKLEEESAPYSKRQCHAPCMGKWEGTHLEIIHYSHYPT